MGPDAGGADHELRARRARCQQPQQRPAARLPRPAHRGPRDGPGPGPRVGRTRPGRAGGHRPVYRRRGPLVRRRLRGGDVLRADRDRGRPGLYGRGGPAGADRGRHPGRRLRSRGHRPENPVRTRARGRHALGDRAACPLRGATGRGRGRGGLLPGIHQPAQAIPDGRRPCAHSPALRPMAAPGQAAAGCAARAAHCRS